MSLFGDFGMMSVAGDNAEPAFWSRVTRVAINTSTGTQRISVSGLSWTPKAARFIFNGPVGDGDANKSSHCAGSVGATDGTNSWAMSWRGQSGTQGRGSFSGRIFSEQAQISGTAVTAHASFSAFGPGYVDISIDQAPGGAILLTVELFGGADLSAQAGTFSGATLGNTTTITTSFTPNVVFFQGVDNVTLNSVASVAIGNGGFATWDGTTVLQCQHYGNYNTPSGVRSAIGAVGASNAIFQPGASTTGLSAEQFSSTGFKMRSNGFDFSTVGPQAYLALGLGGGASAWCGVASTPTTTGNADLGTASFTPQFASLLTTRFTALDTQQVNGEAFAFSYSSITASARYCASWRVTDAFGSGGTVGEFAESSSTAIHNEDHRSLNDIDATFDSFQSGAVRLNFSNVTATAVKAPLLLIG